MCGDTSLPFYDALSRLNHGIDHILTRDERSAGYMADAYARVSGMPGVCEGPSGGGATYILPALVEANESSIPVLAITSDVPVASRGKYPLTELDQTALFRPLTKWNAVIDLPSQIPGYFRTAFRSMTTGRCGAAHIGLPYDVQKQDLDTADIWAQPQHQRYPAFRVGPDPADVSSAADLILGAGKPIFICGGGVVLSGGSRDLVELAEALQAPVATTVSGIGAISHAHPLSVGVVGTNGGTDETRQIVEAADLVVFVGCRAGSTTTEHWTVPTRGRAKIVHIDLDPLVVGNNYYCDAAIVGDAALALQALRREIQARSPKLNGSRGELAGKLAEALRRKRDRFAQLAASNERPIRPERVLATLQRVLPKEAIVVADPGTPCPYFAGHFQFETEGRHYITNRAQGALGFAMSASVGAWYGRPQAKVVSVMGDGSFAFTVGELETIRRKNIPITFIVFSNSAFGWIKASQKDGYEERYFSVDFSRTDHAAVANAYGIKSWRVEDPADLEAALSAAVRYDGPTLIDIVSQPLEETAVPVSKWMG